MTTTALTLLKIAVDRIQDGPDAARIAFLGYPDITAPDEAYVQMFGPGALDRLVSRPNQDRIIAIHGAQRFGVTRVPTLESLMALMTARPLELTVIDIATYVGWETILDLNEPVPDEMKQRFDLVWEGGTLEHVFDIAQALANCASMCRLGGMVFHALPMNWLNHGFYNVNPTLMVDFHEDNGFRTIGLQGSANPWRTEFFEIPFHDRFRLDGEANLIYLAERVEIRDRFVKPIQRRYRDPSRWS